jgi:hypothetical protein
MHRNIISDYFFVVVGYEFDKCAARVEFKSAVDLYHDLSLTAIKYNNTVFGINYRFKRKSRLISFERLAHRSRHYKTLVGLAGFRYCIGYTCT